MSARPRILIAECMQEISSFNPVPSEYADFRIDHGEAMRPRAGGNSALGGAVPVFEAAGMEPVFTVSARAGSAGLLSAAGWARLSAEVLEAVGRGVATGID